MGDELNIMTVESCSQARSCKPHLNRLLFSNQSPSTHAALVVQSPRIENYLKAIIIANSKIPALKSAYWMSSRSEPVTTLFKSHFTFQ